MAKATLYHNPRCTKSRQALAYMNDYMAEDGAEHISTLEVVEYLKQPLNSGAVHALFSALNIDSALKMIRVKEPEFALAGLSKSSSNEEVLQAVVDYPKLLERPILLVENENSQQAAIGRPLDLIIDLLANAHD